MWFGFRSSFGIGDLSSWGCMPSDVVLTMMSVVCNSCFRDSGL